MSAFILSNNHIAALVDFGSRHRAEYFFDNDWRAIYGREKTAGGILLNANYRSVNCRYDTAESGKFTFIEPARTYEPVEILKACDCYNYQACETEDYYQSEASAIIDAIRKAAICALPGYEEAPWEILGE